MKTTDIKLDKDSLPSNGQKVKFQKIGDEIEGKWHTGEYVSSERMFLLDGGDFVFASDVLRWMPLENKEKFEWTDYLVLKFAKIAMGGQYNGYEGCNTTAKKLQRFISLENESNNHK